MNEALMKVVERAVRPVRANQARKLQMRLELLAHLTALYEEERERLGDDDAAFEAACRRFGDPAELSRELDRSVGGLGRMSWAAQSVTTFLDRQIGYREDRSIAWHAGRAVLLAALSSGVLVGLVAFLVFVVLAEDPTRTQLFALFPFFLFVGSLTIVLHGTGILLAADVFDAERPRWRRLLSHAVGCVIALGACFYAMWRSVVDDPSGLVADFPIVLAVLALLPAGLMLLAWSSEQAARPHREWSRLRLDE